MKIADYIISVRRRLHSHPELGFREFETQKFLMSELRKSGFSVNRRAGTGIEAVLKKGRKDTCLMLRADMDALPIEEKTDKVYKSRIKGVMHACGHDGNMAIVLGAAKLLSKEIPYEGILKVIFQPNEEGSLGADSMIKAGVLDNPRPSAIYGVHVNPLLPAGTIGIKEDEFMASVDEITITFEGSGGHAAMPHSGHDLISICSRLISYMNEAVARKVAAQSPCVVSFCIIRAGERFNVMPSKLELTGTIRVLNEKVRKKIIVILKKFLSGLEKLEGIKTGLVINNLGNVLYNDAGEVSFIRNAVRKHYPASVLKIGMKPSMGGEDFARYLKKVRGAFFYFGTGNKKIKTDFPWHHNRFDIDEKGLVFGAECLAKIVEERFNATGDGLINTPSR